MAPSDFANADIPTVVSQLTTEEAISLIAGVGFWHTHAVPRLGIPAVKVSSQKYYFLEFAHRFTRRSVMVRMVNTFSHSLNKVQLSLYSLRDTW